MLLICLYHPNDPGYLLFDKAVYYYFVQLTTDNNMNFATHSTIASFLVAAHKIMLEQI